MISHAFGSNLDRGSWTRYRESLGTLREATSTKLLQWPARQPLAVPLTTEPKWPWLSFCACIIMYLLHWKRGHWISWYHALQTISLNSSSLWQLAIWWAWKILVLSASLRKAYSKHKLFNKLRAANLHCIYIYIHTWLSPPIQSSEPHQLAQKHGKDWQGNWNQLPTKRAWTLLEQAWTSSDFPAGNWAVHSMLRYPSTWQPWRCRSNILDHWGDHWCHQHARTWLHWWQIHGIFIFPIPKENSRNN